MNQYTIIDLDNCISDDGWRMPMINPAEPDIFKRYHPYHRLMARDYYKNQQVVPDNGILIFTARPNFYRSQTETWLRANKINVTHLIMRNDDDHRSSVDVKRAMLLNLAHYDISLQQITLAVDDHYPVIQMYREHKINAVNVFIHEPTRSRELLSHPLTAKEE